MKFGRWICAIKRIPFSCLCPFMETRRDPFFLHKRPVIFWKFSKPSITKKPPRFQNQSSKETLWTKSKGEKLHSITYWIHPYWCSGNVIPAGLANSWDLWSCSSIVPSRPSESEVSLVEWNIQWPLFICMYSDHISLGVVGATGLAIWHVSQANAAELSLVVCLWGTTSNSTIIIPYSIALNMSFHLSSFTLFNVSEDAKTRQLQRNAFSYFR